MDPGPKMGVGTLALAFRGIAVTGDYRAVWRLAGCTSGLHLEQMVTVMGQQSPYDMGHHSALSRPIPTLVQLLMHLAEPLFSSQSVGGTDACDVYGRFWVFTLNNHADSFSCCYLCLVRMRKCLFS